MKKAENILKKVRYVVFIADLTNLAVSHYIGNTSIDPSQYILWLDIYTIWSLDFTFEMVDL